MGDAEDPCSPRQVTHVHTEAQREENNDESGAFGARRDAAEALQRNKSQDPTSGNQAPCDHQVVTMANNRIGHKLTGTTLTRANEAKTGSNRTYHDRTMDLCLKASHRSGMKHPQRWELRAISKHLKSGNPATGW